MIPGFLAARIDSLLHERLLGGGGLPDFDFTHPPGEPALAGPDSVSWRVFRNPLALYLGGITAVLLELAEPRVRTGVWEHTTFRTDPLLRMRRTGLAAMITVYGACAGAERMIAGVRRMHERVRGETPDGIPYQADDPELLRWVHATALFGFMEAYHRYVRPLSDGERNSFVADGTEAATLYGAAAPPSSEAELIALLESTHIEKSEIIHEFLHILRRLPVLPGPLQSMAIRAAVGLLPPRIRETLSLGREFDRSASGDALFRRVGMGFERLPLPSSPATRACLRLGLPADHLVPRIR